MLTATRKWHCDCCEEEIKPGEKFRIVKGEFYKLGHPKGKIILNKKSNK